MSNSSASRRWFSHSRSALLVIGVACAAWGIIFWRQIKLSPAQEHINTGIQLLKAGRQAEAEQQWLEATKLDPKSDEAWSLLGDFYLKSRNYKSANEAYKHLLQSASSTPNLQENLALCAYQLQNFSDAQLYAEQALKQNPDNISALQVLSDVENRNGQSDERLTHLKRLVELQPQIPAALAALVEEMGKRHEYVEVLPYLNRWVKLAPDSSTPYYERAVALYIANPDPQAMIRAQADLQRVLELEPDNVDAHRYLGRIYMRQNKPRDAITEFELIGRGRPYASAHFLELANAYRQAGNNAKATKLQNIFLNLRQFNNKLIDFGDHITTQPTNGELFLQLGSLLMQSIETDENYYQLYRYKYLTDQLRSVDIYFKEAKRLRPNDAAVQKALLQLETNYKKHLQAAGKALAQNNVTSVKAELGRAILLRSQDERTKKALQQSVSRGIEPLGTKEDLTPKSTRFGEG